ncbi:MAG TPA: hypothetical protein VI876_12505 [Dehalococcoidia bacterium]|nr:hypothetical protein [Dehalococcoidia bacterium]
MEWGILIVVLLLLFTGFVIVQETARQMHWRGLVESGDLEAIRTLIEDELEGWRESRVPRGTPALLWHGIQTVELLDVTPTSARVSCNAEGEYALVGARRIETSSPLVEAMKITKRLAEMLLYDVPNVKLDHVQIDVYTSFRDENGHAEPRCILSTLIARSAVEHIDWEETEPADFVSLTEGRFSGNGAGLHAVEPIAFASAPSEAE